ncbi:MAG: LacI family DNA-binding transcriptional regulator [Sphaerochaetaceae bacterium]|nr:LacI family DNA-binding transcriptional regulator [Sphaerochaetaceae bacterium]HHU88877.1 LacI family transcriptional regulator [Spirochaetales bacterium]
MNKITIDDVAKHAGVSKTSVSYVLSGKKKLSAEVERRILEAVETLGYTPPKMVSRLNTKTPKTINFCLPLEKGTISNDPYYIPLIEGAMDYAFSCGYHLCITRITQGDEKAKKMFLDSLQFVKGVILCNLHKDVNYEQILVEKNIPYVANGTPDTINTKYYVDADIEGAGYQAASLLLKKGHTNIFYINLDEDLIQSHHRLSGFKLAHKEFGVPWKDENHAYCNVSLEDSTQLMDGILSRKNSQLSAVVTSNEIQAWGTIKALQKKKIQIPQQVAVVSMGGSSLSVLGFPNITTIDFDPIRIGTESARMLIEVIERKRIRPSHIIVPGKLIERESS